jgi:hypothetical protein
MHFQLALDWKELENLARHCGIPTAAYRGLTVSSGRVNVERS